MIGGLDQGVSMGELIDFKNRRLMADSSALLISAIYCEQIKNRNLKLSRGDFEADLRQRRYPAMLRRKILGRLEKMDMIIPDRKN